MLTAVRIREVVDYDPATGIFTRKVRLAQRHKVGDRADFLATGWHLFGYRRLSVDGKRYLAHRCAWLYVHGVWPENEIDHLNGDKSDNRISNLRDVSREINAQNKRVPRQDNKSGLTGVHYHPQSGKWRARLQHRGRAIEGGLHETAERAHGAYLALKRRFHPGCTI